MLGAVLYTFRLCAPMSIAKRSPYATVADAACGVGEP